MKELSTKYNHLEVEKGKYQEWVNKGYFKSGDKSKKPFTIVIPPPNVTSNLHLGHAWDVTIQDIIIRRKRMQGYDALWLPGMDHAGIATQAKVDQKLKAEGKNRFELGREKFLEEAWKWKDKYAGVIRNQWEAMGISVDYDKERFTLDEGLNNAVNQVFIKLYEKGIIYRGERAINWDPEAKTALSNIEVIHKETKGKMYYLKYMIEGTNDYIEVATTRPETLGGDKALVVHPKDERYKDLVGKNVITPFRKESVPIITDEYIDMDFGSGAMKCSTHATADFDILKKHNLPIEECINPDGRLNKFGLEFEGMTRQEARVKIAEKLDKEGLLIKVEDHVHQVGHSERTDAIVEVMVMPQWFVKMDHLSEQALSNQKNDKRVEFVPARFENNFQRWMENIHDWCISRQLWWGHRIPAWYKGEEVKVQVESPGEGWVRDEDVLDTWFSSALWPFSTLGWPDNTEDVKRYFPTDVLVTGYDILFFWVARMIFTANEFMDEKPFKEVLLHGLIRDDQNRKMSKSLGNGVDPMDMKEKYGIDSLRYFLTTNSSPGLDLRFEIEKVESSWNFINKLWNITRYCQQNVKDFDYKNIDLTTSKLNTTDKYILHRLNETIKQADFFYDRYEFNEASKVVYNFAWDDFASWYLEMTKVDLQESNTSTTLSVLTHVLNELLKLLHPFMPFVTEELYQSIPHKEESIMISAWPTYKEEFNFENNLKQFKELESIIKTIRKTRNEANCPMSKQIRLFISASNKEMEEYLKTNARYIEKFTNPQSIEIAVDLKVDEKCTTDVLPQSSIFIPLEGLIDKEAEREKLTKEISKVEFSIQRSSGMLNNPKFMAKAPEVKVNEEKANLEIYKKQLEELKLKLKDLD